MEMKTVMRIRLTRIAVLAWLILCAAIVPAVADVDYDPEVIMQVPHQPILNNERLPGTTGNTGALGYAVPVQVAPGRAELQPELALAYNSSSRRNSWVGVGWSLELGSIERSKKQRVDFDDDDAFIYNGSVELVRRPDWGSDYYGARIEEAFIKFHYLGNSNGWEVLFPDGRTQSFGTSGNAQLQAPGGVFRWLLDETRDPNGNAMTVTYDKRAGDAIYPLRIAYSPGSSVEFTTETRQDVYPVYTGYTREEASRRLKEIRCYGNGGLAHRYVLTYGYSDHSQRSLLLSVREYGAGSSTSLPATTFSYEDGNQVRINVRRSRSTNFVNYPGMTHFADINGDGFTDMIKFMDATTRADVYLGDANGSFGSNTNSEAMEEYNSSGGIHFGDINGDGKADCVVARRLLTGAVAARAYLGDSGGDLNFADQVLTLSAYSKNGMIQLADVNGDGMADLIEFPTPLAAGSSNALVHLALGDGQFDPDTLDSPLCSNNDSGRVFMADVNGDGMADVLQTNAQNQSVYVHLSAGNGHFDGCVTTDLGHSMDKGSVNLGDINGDGLSDIILTPPLSEMVYTYFSNGTGGFVFAQATDTNQTNDLGYTLFGDVSGDGFVDMVKCEQYGTRARLYLGDGAGGFSYHSYKSTDNDGLAALLDINNDGLADLLKFKTNNRYVYSYMAEGLADNDVRPDILSRISNGYGVVADIAYRPSTAFSDVHQPSGSYPDAYLPFPIDLVTSIAVNDSIGHTATSTYGYHGARYDIRERELLGMARIVRTNPNNTTLTTRYDVSDYYYKGRAISSDYDDNGSRDYLNTDYTWEHQSLDNGARWVRLDREDTDLRSGGATVQTGTRYSYKFDTSADFGYLYEAIRSGDGEAKLTTRTTQSRVGGSREWILRMTDQRIILGSTTARHVSYRYDGDGNPTRETHANNDGSNGVINRGYDGYGNVTSETDLNGNKTTYSYTNGAFVSRENFEGLVTTYSGYNQWGKPARSTDPNGGTTRYSYDDYGRVTEEDTPGPGSKEISYHDTARPRYTVTTITDGTTTYDYIDGLDRPLQSTVSSADGHEITTRTYYDSAGRVTKTTGPFFTSGYGYFSGSTPSSAPYSDITGFDFLNRPLSMVSAHDSGTATTTIGYKGFNRTVTDPDGNATTEYRDYLGRIQTIEDADGKKTTYNYTGAGDLTQVRDCLGNRIGLTRNTLGHLTDLDDPDLGRWSFTYQPNGEVKTRRDQQGQTITWWYDDRNRVTSKVYGNESPSEPDVSYTYDAAINGKGRLFQVTKGNVTTTYNTYDDMGRVTRKTVTIDGSSYVFNYTYDGAGNLTRTVFPDGYAVNYSYHNNSNLIAGVWAAGPDIDVDISDYNNFGKPGRIDYPALTTDIGYFSRTGRVESITVPGLIALSYSYSKAGDVRSIYDTARNFAYTYDYDNLHRLTRESASGPFKMADSRDINLYYEGTEAHAVSRVVADGGERNLIYEDNGNLTIGYDIAKTGEFPERRLDYNAENMPVSIEYEPQGGPVTTVALTYDGDGRRVKKQAGTNTVIYVDNTYEIRNGQPVKYIFAGNLRLAKVSGGTVRYYHKDHLGSSALVTDASGSLVDSMVFEAFGQPRETCQPVTGDVAYTYTDQEWDAESGLYNYDARLYDAVLGRFLSADSVYPKFDDEDDDKLDDRVSDINSVYNPQMLSRYSYVQNNPVNAIDPFGLAEYIVTWNYASGTVGVTGLTMNGRVIDPRPIRSKADGKIIGYNYLAFRGAFFGVSGPPPISAGYGEKVAVFEDNLPNPDLFNIEGNSAISNNTPGSKTHFGNLILKIEISSRGKGLPDLFSGLTGSIEAVRSSSILSKEAYDRMVSGKH